MLGFAGRDGRCYPSVETLGHSVGVSDRQARDYVKELERAGLIVIEQRGLRKTNVYLFVWTAELDRLSIRFLTLRMIRKITTDRYHRAPRTGAVLPFKTGTALPLLTGTVVPLKTGSWLPVP